MAVNVVLHDVAAGNEVKMLLKATDTVEDIIENAAAYWHKPSGAYILKLSSDILNGRATVKEAGIKSNDILEFMLDPQGG